MGDHQSEAAEEQLDGSVPEAGAREAPAEADPVAELTAERDQYLALAQRTQADFENFRKRAARDAQVAGERGTAKVVKELLPALDNLERALAAAEAQEGEDHHLTAGIRLVQKDLAAALERVGIEAFSPKGEVFDPNEHEAMAQLPSEDAESGTVIDVYQSGYRINGAVLRPARVVVAT